MGVHVLPHICLGKPFISYLSSAKDLIKFGSAMLGCWLLLSGTLYGLASVASAGQELSIPQLFQISSELPPCATTCSLQTLTPANCSVQDMRNCLCTNVTLQSELFTCVHQICNYTEQLSAATISQTLICNGIPQPSRQYQITRITIVITVFTFLVLILRIISRVVLHQFWWDDWVIVVTAILMVPMSVLPIYNASRGFGTHAWNIKPEYIMTLRKTYYVSQLLYVVVQNTAKISILFLYLRIFPDRTFRLWTKILAVWITIRCFSFLIGVTLQCVPIRGVWEVTLEAKCINSTAIVFAGAAFSISEDIVIILMPIPQLKELNLTLRKRLALIVMFAVGSFACITSMLRMKYISMDSINDLDVTWSNVDVIIWSILEVYTAAICSSLITIRPLLIKCFPSLFPASTNPQSTGQQLSSSWRGGINFRSSNNRFSNNRFELMSRDDMTTGCTENDQRLRIQMTTNFELKEERTGDTASECGSSTGHPGRWPAELEAGPGSSVTLGLKL
ncbi:hypothetical protein BJ878DRAFT_517457 [Calycina marina]|uniref:CFEM domain-containing protein n=1 Tax=Calycina marina TaxID=1763456 RepID=A0A9P7YYB0_9HELO|nr:hypothetical protein BJ878DRAFT_517457 [Calycina marina]